MDERMEANSKIELKAESKAESKAKSKLRPKMSGILLACLVFTLCISLFGCGDSKVKDTADSDNEEKEEVLGTKWEHGALGDEDFLKADGTVLKNENGEEIVLRGTNAGGWLLQEFWMCPTRQSENMTCQKEMMQILRDRFGDKKAEALINIYEDNFWTEEDFDNCKDMGMNVIRLPFTYMNLLDDDGNLRDGAFKRLDWFVDEAGSRGMYVILDMHGAQGSQNEKDHSGDTTQGAAFFYGDNAKKNQNAYVKLWKKIAKHFEKNPAVAGYDLLNEPYCDLSENTGKTCWDIYDRAYSAIREVDPDHIIIMEAKWDPQNLPDPGEYGWENAMYEYHQYNYDDQHTAQSQFEGIELKLDLSDAADYNVPVYIGETSFFDNTDSWKMCLNEMNRRGCSYTTWTYEVTGNGESSWGIYNLQAEEADIEHDGYETISEKWSSLSEKKENTAIKELLEKYYTGCYESEE